MITVITKRDLENQRQQQQQQMDQMLQLATIRKRKVEAASQRSQDENRGLSHSRRSAHDVEEVYA